MLGASERASERGKRPRGRQVPILIEKEVVTLRYVAMVAKFLELNKSRTCKYGKNKKPERY